MMEEMMETPVAIGRRHPSTRNAAQTRNGFVCRSSPTVVMGPCPL